MPQSNQARENEIAKHPEHVADRAQASHDHQTHLTPQEKERREEEQQHGKHGQAAQHENAKK